MYDDFEVLVSPAEAARIAGFRTAKDFFVVTEIAEEYQKNRKAETLGWLLVTIWNAGRLQGIREERARRKQK